MRALLLLSALAALMWASPAQASTRDLPLSTATGTIVGGLGGALVGGLVWASLDSRLPQGCENELDCGLPSGVRVGLFGATTGFGLGASAGAFVGYGRASEGLRSPLMWAGLGATAVGSTLILTAPRHGSTLGLGAGIALNVASAPACYALAGVFGEPERPTSVRLTPSFGRDRGGLTLAGRF